MIVPNKKIVNFLFKKFPLKLQEEWDESGFRNFNGVKTPVIVLTLDPNLEAVELAMRKHAHLIISHHPIFVNNPDIGPSPADKKVISLLKKNKIDLLSLHTNVDNSPIGINPHVLNKFGCTNIKIVKSKSGHYFTSELKTPVKTSDLLKRFKKTFNTTRVISLAKNNNRVVKRIVLLCGAGFSVLKDDLNKFKPTDLVLTGDLKWHEWTLAQQLDINLVDIAHDVEKEFINMVEPILKQEFKQVTIIKSYPSIIFNII